MLSTPVRPPAAPSSQTPGMQVRTGVAELMRWAGRSEIRRELYGAAAAELSPNEATLLEFLAKHGPVRISELAAEQGVDKSTMSPQVRRLEDKGLIGREPDPNDGRAALLATSQKGNELQDSIDAAGAAAFDAILSTWSAEDREALGSMLVRFAGELNQQDFGHPSPAQHGHDDHVQEEETQQ